MADRSGAYLFGRLFKLVSGEGELTPEELWKLSREYDFDPYQMYIDDTLERLGFLRECNSCGDFTYGPQDEPCNECGKFNDV